PVGRVGFELVLRRELPQVIDDEALPAPSESFLDLAAVALEDDERHFEEKIARRGPHAEIEIKRRRAVVEAGQFPVLHVLLAQVCLDGGEILPRRSPRVQREAVAYRRRASLAQALRPQVEAGGPDDGARK